MTMTPPMTANASRIDPKAAHKQKAAERAVEFVRSGMTVGLGTGTTAVFATRRIGALLREGKLRDVVGIATSRATEQEAKAAGIPLMSEVLDRDVDLTIDGADEVDPDFNLIKGGGGALLREKIVAQASRRVVIVIDSEKCSPRLGTRFALPVEVVPFGHESQRRFLEALNLRPTLRVKSDGAAALTDQGNVIYDCATGPIADAAKLAAQLAGRAGIVEHGLFLNLATDLVVAGPQGVQHRTRR
jgi:ribose 5-phosphate isomerase A